MPRQQQHGRGVLRVATHNVRGLRSHVVALAKVWLEQRLDVICVQESHLPFAEAARVCSLLNSACRVWDTQHPGFHAVWGLNTVDSRSAGVLLLVKKSLVDTEALVLQEGQAHRDLGGRLLSVPVSWGGHSFRLSCVYLPNDSPSQQTFVNQHLAPLLQVGGEHVVAGDWNFVADPALDKVSAAPLGGAAHSPAPSAALHRAAGGGLCDVFRLLHPTRRAFTHHSITSAARLDRVYCTQGLSAYAAQCVVVADTPSDHRLVVMELAARVQNQLGSGMRRLRLHQFAGQPALWQQFKGWVQQQADAAPIDPVLFLGWWPVFKAKLLEEGMRLGREARGAAGQAARQARQQAGADLAVAYGAVETATTQQQLSQALQNVLVARQHWCDCVQQHAGVMQWQQRKQWVHSQERPSPTLTSMVSPHAAKQDVPPMRSPVTGALASGGKPLAQVVADYWARVSAAPAVEDAAVGEVMHAVASLGLKVPEAEAALVGAADVSADEVKAALRHAPSGKSPGLDGLPVELWRKCAQVCVPLLTRLFNAIGATGQLPVGFTKGAIVVIYKSGSRADPASYRPITLLNTDYRLLAKLLAYRLKSVQAKVIEPEQTAFLPDRCIGDNIMLLQLLPHALPASSEAVAVFLDFTKAYDTVSRPFLYRLLQEAGLGGGFLRWVQLLLQQTLSCAVVNGHISNAVPFEAGVRQGCPLAPQLYLFVGQAMLALLKHKGFGVHVGGKCFVASQFADDAQVFLQSLACLPALLHAMAVFKAASGQALHMGKTEVLLLGRALLLQLWQDYHLQRLQADAQRQHAQQPPPQQQPQQVRAPRGGFSQLLQKQRVAVLRVKAQARRRGGRQPPPVHDQVQRQLRQQVQAVQQAQRAEALLRTRVQHGVIMPPPPVLQQHVVDQHIMALARDAACAQLRADPCSPPPGASCAGLKLVGLAKALGVLHMSSGQSLVDWGALLDKVRGKLQRVARLPLSMFGRAFACGGYALSKLLFAAEFAGELPQHILDALQTDVAKVVDRKQAPADTSHLFAGVSAGLLRGHPKQGGCGVMPLQEHIRARHALWGVRLMLGSSDTPWVHLAMHILAAPGGLADTNPMWPRLGIYMCNVEQRLGPGGRPLPPPLLRLAAGLHAVPQWRDVAASPLSLGPWCAQAPLWCNPFLRCQPGQPLPSRGLEQLFPEVAALGTINTVQQAVDALAAVDAARPVSRYHDTVWETLMGSSMVFRDWQVAQEQLAALVAAIPPAWRYAARQQQRGGVQNTAQVVDMLVARLGWRLPTDKVCPVADVTVAGFTKMQLRPQLDALANKHASFLQLVAQSMPQQPAPGEAELVAMLSGVWRLPWDNNRKELLWRLVLDGLPTAARMHKHDDCCACGAQCPGRQHHFWSCPVAVAVRLEMQRQLPPGCILQQQHLWMGRVPHPGMHRGVWLVAMLAALLGMEKGRKLLCRWKLEQHQGQHVQSPAQQVQAASQVAVATLWDMLADFVGLKLCPPKWLLEVGVGHPFLAVHAPAGADWVLQVHRVQPGQG